MGYIDFTFDGISARDMRIKSIRVEENIMTFPFVTSTNESSVRLMDSEETHLFKLKRDNLSIPLELMIVDENGDPRIWTHKDIYNIADWLVKDHHKPLILGDKPHVIYYAYLADSDGLHHYANGGVLPVTFVTNSPYGWSIPEMLQFDCSSGGTTINLINKSNVTKYHRPVIELLSLTEGQTIKITNITNSDDSMELTGLHANETISIDNEKELIYTDVPLAKLGDRFNYKWLKLRRGSNEIKIEGNCELRVRNQFSIVS